MIGGGSSPIKIHAGSWEKANAALPDVVKNGAKGLKLCSRAAVVPTWAAQRVSRC
jgi:hypothetical protein